MARAQLGLTQRAFAKRIGVSQGLVAAWENHTKTPGAASLKRISDETGISMDAIAGGGVLVPKALNIVDAAEIRLIFDFRRLPRIAKKNLLEFVEMTANVGRIQQKKGAPTEI